LNSVTRSGGELVCAALAGAGARVLFSVSGNQILPVYDAAGEAGLRIIHTRHESAAAYAAAAWAHVSGGLGVALTSAGPGFLAALQGIAAARSMELPLLFLSGDSPVSQREMGAFQELNQEQVASAVCKDSFSADSVEAIPAIMADAARLSRSGVPGPVHVSLPGDVLSASSLAADINVRAAPERPSSGQLDAIDAIAERLRSAKRPLVLARPSVSRGTTGARLRWLAAALGIEPVVVEAPRGLADLKYVEISARYPESDCALVIGPADFGLGFLAPDMLAADGSILLVDAPGDPEPEREIEIHLRADPSLVVELLSERIGSPAAVDPEWSGLWPLTPPPEAETVESGVHPLAVSAAVREAVGPDGVIVLDGGEFCQWIRLGLRDLPNPVLWNGKIGAIGGGIPMALGAAVAKPSQRVIAIMGDGAAGYHLSEFETLARYGLRIVAVIGNDARWAAEWHLQVARYGPERAFETELLPARYDLVASGFDAYGETVAAARELPGALREALGRTGASCINVRVAALPSPAALG
jgi:acetolactate synthase-1/2/3 large subunit